MKKTKVSVICMTYNHVNFIRQTLDGFIMQKTNFPFEVIIHDDASTDGTADIIREYAKKYPDIIKPVLQKENQWKLGKSIPHNYIYPKIKGEYVAVCDGDDYWTDPNKLQKQSDFLDKHPDYSICFHPVQVFFENNSKQEYIFPGHVKKCNIETLMKANFIPNSAVMYRWCLIGKDTRKFWPDYPIYPGDWWLHLVHAKRGKIKFMPKIMARYRRHDGGVSYIGTKSEDKLHMLRGVNELNFFCAVRDMIAPNPTEYNKYVCACACKFLGIYAKNGDIDNAVKILQKCPDLLYQDTKKFASEHKRFQHLFNKVLAFAILELLIIIGMIL